MIVPDVRCDVLHDLHAAPGQSVDGIGRRRLDQVDAARQQRRRAGRGLRRADQHHAVRLRQTLGIPVGPIGYQLDPFARHQAGKLERAGARWLRRELVPVLAELLELGRTGNQEPQHLIGEERVDRLGLHLHGHVVELLVACHRRQARPHLRGLALVELRRLGIEHLVEVPDHGVGIEGRTVVELHVGPELECPQRLVGVVDLPFGGEAGDQLARPVGDIHLPRDQRIVERIAGELVGAGAAVGLAGRERHVRHRDAEAHDLLVGPRRRTETCGQGERAGAGQDRAARKAGLADHVGLLRTKALGDAAATAWRARRRHRRRTRWPHRMAGRRAGSSRESRRCRSRSTR